MKNNLIRELATATSLPFIVLIVSPITMFLGNRKEYGDTSSLLVALFLAFLSASVFLFLFLRLSTRWPLFRRILGGILVGLALAAWIQSQLFLWDFGPLDGRGVPWEKFDNHARLEILTWALATLLVVAAFVKRSRLAPVMPTGVWAIGLISIVASYATFNSNGLEIQRNYKSPHDSLIFHRNQNSIILVLDTYQSDVFSEIMKKHPEEVAFLEGFSYYPNTLGGYPTTRHSIPLILTGKSYKNDFPFTAEKRIDFESESLASYYRNLDFGITGNFELTAIEFGEEKINFPPKLRQFSLYGLSDKQIQGIDIGLFRASPIFLKKHIYDEGRWLLSTASKDKFAPPPPHAGDWYFTKQFEFHANTESDRQGEFKFIHLIGAHAPFSLNERYEYVAGLSNTRESYINQARGVLLLAKRALAQLKRLGIYQEAEILIVSDHGTHNIIPTDLHGNVSNPPVPLEHMASARPLFLYKPSGATEALNINEQAMHLSYIPCLLSNMQQFDCEEFRRALSGDPVVRPHYRYEWIHDFWSKEYSPPMKLYEVRGDVRDVSSWSRQSTIYRNGHAQPVHYLSGEPVDFGMNGTSDQHILHGWSGQEGDFRWTDGQEASLSFYFPEGVGKNLALEVDALGFSPDRVNPQDVTVLANNTPIGKWQIKDRGKFKVRIPSSVVTNADLTITFLIRQPTSPHELGLSDGRRKLGIAVHSLELTIEG